MKRIYLLFAIISSALAAEVLKIGDGECVAPTKLVAVKPEDMIGTYETLAAFQPLIKTDCHKMKFSRINDTSMDWKIVWKGFLIKNTLRLVLVSTDVDGVLQMYLRGLFSVHMYLGNAYTISTENSRTIICSCRSGNLIINTNTNAKDCYVITKDKNAQYTDADLTTDQTAVIDAGWDGGRMTMVKRGDTQCKLINV